MQLDVSLPGGDLREIAAVAGEWERIGIGRLWSSETQHDPFLPLAAAAIGTDRIGLGTSVAIAFARSPMVLAHTAWDLQRTSRGRLVVGLGTQVKAHNERRFSVPWTAPAPRLREVVLALRAIWRSWQRREPLAFHGRHYRFDLMTPFFDPGPIDHPDIPIFLGGVNPQMCRLAGEVADGLHVHSFHSPRYLERVVRPAVADGLRATGRSAERFTLHARVFAIVGESDEQVANARAVVRQQIAFYASTRTYAPVLAAHGWEALTSELHALSLRGQWKAMAELVTDEMLEAYTVTGTYEDLGERLRRRYAGLLDRVSLYRPLPLAPSDPRWAALVRAVSA